MLVNCVEYVPCAHETHVAGSEDGKVQGVRSGSDNIVYPVWGR